MRTIPSLGMRPSRLVAHPPGLDLPFTTITVLDPAVTLTRTTPATYFGADGLLHTAAAGSARLDDDPVTLAPLGLLIEAARANLWYPSTGSIGDPESGLTRTPNAGLAPDGTTASTLVTASVAGKSLEFYRTATNNTTYTFSVYAKAGTAATFTAWDYIHLAIGTVNLANGTAPAGVTMKPCGNGFVRCSWSVVSITTAVTFRIYSASGGSFYLWGAQIEAGTEASSYIATSGSAIARAADVATISLPYASDLLIQDRAGAAWSRGVPAGIYTLTPRSGQTHIARLRAWPAGRLSEVQQSLLQVAA